MDTSNEYVAKLKFVGRFLALALTHTEEIDLSFTPVFYKMMLGQTIQFEDLENIDPEIYKRLKSILENDVTDTGLAFNFEESKFENIIETQLLGGKSILVNTKNKQKFVKRVLEQKVAKCTQLMAHVLEGFYELIPRKSLTIFDEHELEFLFCGLHRIIIDDWEKITTYIGYTSESPQIRWFWQTLRALSFENRARLLQFSTGTASALEEDFKSLQFIIQCEDKDNIDLRSITSQMYFNKLILPRYSTYEYVKTNIMKVIKPDLGK